MSKKCVIPNETMSCSSRDTLVVSLQKNLLSVSYESILMKYESQIKEKLKGWDIQ